MTGWPTAITGTWTDLERHAVYVYENSDEQTSEWMLAEAVLVLSGILNLTERQLAEVTAA